MKLQSQYWVDIRYNSPSVNVAIEAKLARLKGFRGRGSSEVRMVALTRRRGAGSGTSRMVFCAIAKEFATVLTRLSDRIEYSG